MISWKHKLAAFLISVSFCLLLLLLAEFYCRWFTDINFRRTSRDFVVTNAAGTVVANAKNAHGISFGTDVYSDENGFRVNPLRTEKSHDQAVLFLGDSVTFGVGIPEEKTFVGMFREKNPDLTTYNSAVVGFSIPDYRRVITTFLPAHPEVKTVYLFYCLNDFHDESEMKTAAEQTLTSFLKTKAAAVLESGNEFFGAHSKFYVYVTGIIIDPSNRYFQSDYETYKVNDEKFNRTIQPLKDINEELKGKNIKFVVFINPYEKQLRSGAEADLMPQKRLENYFRQHDIQFVDTLQNFKNINPAEGFLFKDPAHLSEKGHQIVFDALWQNWINLPKN